jgi:hypothetical protein
MTTSEYPMVSTFTLTHSIHAYTLSSSNYLAAWECKFQRSRVDFTF